MQKKLSKALLKKIMKNKYLKENMKILMKITMLQRKILQITQNTHNFNGFRFINLSVYSFGCLMYTKTSSGNNIKYVFLI